MSDCQESTIQQGCVSVFRLPSIGFFFAACAVALVFAVTAQSRSAGQQRPAGIFVKGTVRDTAGAPIPGCEVTLEEKTRSESVEGKTGSDGAFSFLAMRPGTYLVRVKRTGFRGAFTEPMELSTGQTKKVEFVLKALAADVPPPPPELQPSSGAQKTSEMEFSDAPNFAVAGVTDWSNAGLHGSDANARTSEALNKETLALKENAKSPPQKAASTKATSDASGEASKAEGHRVAGDRAEEAGDPLAAEREYQAAVRLDPSEANYFAWGAELLVHKAVQQAIEVYTRGAAAHPRSARMLIGLGAALYAGNAPQEAVAKVCAAADLRATDATAYLFLGEMQAAVTDALPCAEEKLARFARERPENAVAKYYYAMALWKHVRGLEGSPRRSDDCQAGTKPCSAPTRTGANALEVEKLLREALRLEPKLAEAHLQLGILCADQGKFPAAIEAYQRAIAANSELADAHYRLGQAYKRIGEEAKAEQEFAAHKQAQKAESDRLERQRKELQQFVIVLKDQRKE